MDLAEALAWLDGHIDYERRVPERTHAPTTERAEALVAALGHPEGDYPVLHITGTNGKGSVARMATALLLSAGITCGTYTSPHLQRINERIRRNGLPIGDGELAEVLTTMRLAERAAGVDATWFELLSAAAYRHFSDEGVAAAVIEVGLGGRWDATNVADAAVAAVTTVDVDHVEYLGHDPVGIATEKAGIVKPGSVLVLGEERPELAAPFVDAGARQVWRRGADFGADDDRVAVGGRLVDLRTPGATYPEVLVPLLGAHQAANAAVALASVEALVGAPLSAEVVADGFAAVEVPGRFEVVATPPGQPVMVLDSAHNAQGARALAATLREDLGDPAPRVWVLGMLGRDPAELLASAGADPSAGDRVVAVELVGPRAHSAAALVDAAESLGLSAEAAPDVAAALDIAREAAGGGAVVVTGSLRLVGAARTVLGLPPA